MKANLPRWAKVSDDIHSFREREGLRPIKEKKVNCLRCLKEFVSKDYPRNRICIDCLGDIDHISPFANCISVAI